MAVIKPRQATVVIYQGDDLAKLQTLDEAVDLANAQFERARRDKAIRLMSSEDAQAVKEAELQDAQVARDEFAAEAETRGVRLVLYARQRSRWRELVDAHPARPDNDMDEKFSVNVMTFAEVLVPESIDVAESDIESGADLANLLDSLSDYDFYDRLFLTAFGLNRGRAIADPTLRLASQPTPPSVETSIFHKKPATGA